jgi:cytochrome P450
MGTGRAADKMERPIERIKSRSGDWTWRVTGHAEVKALLSDERIGMTNSMPARALAGPRGTGITRRASRGQFEYSIHSAWRKVMNKVFSARAFDSMVPVVTKTAEALVDDLVREGPPADVHDKYSVPLTAQVMCSLLGVPTADIARFREWAGDGQDGDGRAPSGDGMAQLMAYAEGLVAQRRGTHADDAVSALLGAASGSMRAHEGRVIRLLAGMLAFGWQTPASMIDSGVLLLLAHPAQRQLLQANPALVTRAADEVLRLSRPPLAVEGGVHRQAHADVDVGGVTIRTGDLVILDLMEANRDSQVFPDPERFEIRRDPNPHLAFGYAFYMCNFSRLARTEIGIGLTTILDGIPGLQPPDQAHNWSASDPSRKESLGKLALVW